MNVLTPLETLYEADTVGKLALPGRLHDLYGPLFLRRAAGRPYVSANFVTTLDGVVSLNEPGHAAGGDISGFNRHDRMVMGLMRAVADAVVAAAGTLRPNPNIIWSAEYIFPELAEEFQTLRRSLGISEPPLNVIVTGSGKIDLSGRVFTSGEVPVLIVTTPGGARTLAAHALPRTVQVATVEADGSTISARAILAAVQAKRPCKQILVEGGPHLMAEFFAEQCIDEQWLTLAPQIAGRGDKERPGLVMGKTFAPANPLWGTLIGVKRSASHLFLRYAFDSGIAA